MKKITLKSTLILFASVLLFASGCSKSDPTPAAETDAMKNTKLLTTGTWNVQTVQVDGMDKTIVYKDLKLTFTSTGFTSIGGGSVWPTTGTWKFTDDTGKVITRGDGLAINVNEISTTKLVVSLAWSKTTLGGGRIESIAGSHVFTFGR